MLYPSIDELVRKVDSKYTLVVAASKRARALREGKPSQLLSPKSHKFVGVALEEIYHDLISVETAQPEEGAAKQAESENE
ncbi:MULTISPECIES: DNA-directed RNA polymerase subunit omega [Cohnella]|jgi:DNA-directed RNA polymerase subunit omega|uniref:DNA-directed RNA polymerase subunit omega n=1 Tax=Cohnella TaxID=329857 RepID=UPI000378FBC9|nr:MULTISPECIES: DNA-directed RNA polymerase subunit omega [Cohnella]REK67147.1 MAG: DNA-directed RNA polymerase subunit omega [Cohnella sp.]